MVKFDSIFEEGYGEAIKSLHKNVTPIGFTATPEKHANYFSIWARDHSVTAIGASLTNDDELVKTAKNGVLFLLRKQIDHGQVPSYVEVENKKKVYGGLGAITSIDSNMWVAIASGVLYRRTKDKQFISKANLDRYKRLYRLFKAFDSNDCGLLEVPVAGDWADIFTRQYHILYDECLYYVALVNLKFLFKEGLEKVQDDWMKKSLRKRINWISKRIPTIKRKINQNFWFTKDNVEKVREEYMIHNLIEVKDYGFYQSHLMPFRHNWSNRFETFGNVLAMISKIADKDKRKSIIKYVLENKVNSPHSIKVLHPPVFRSSSEWESIYEDKERPYEYHNGGVWPFINGFWINSLVKSNRKKLAKQEFLNMSLILKEQGWKFNEYLHGKSGEPMGRTYQAWSAAGYIIAYHSLKSGVNLFNL